MESGIAAEEKYSGRMKIVGMDGTHPSEEMNDRTKAGKREDGGRGGRMGGTENGNGEEGKAEREKLQGLDLFPFPFPRYPRPLIPMFGLHIASDFLLLFFTSFPVFMFVLHYVSFSSVSLVPGP